MNIQPVGSLNVTGEQCCIRQLDVTQGSISPVPQPQPSWDCYIWMLCEIALRLAQIWSMFVYFMCFLYRRRTLQWSGRTRLKTFSCVQEGQWLCRFHKHSTRTLVVIFLVTTVWCVSFALIDKTGCLLWYSIFDILYNFSFRTKCATTSLTTTNPFNALWL